MTERTVTDPADQVYGTWNRESDDSNIPGGVAIFLNPSGEPVPVSAADPMPVTQSGVATAANQALELTALALLDTDLDALNASASSMDTKLSSQATAAKQDSILAKLPTLGPQNSANSFSSVPSTDQNPIFDHANGTKNSVTSSATIITTGSGHTFLRISTDVDIFVNTAGNTAVDDGTSIRIVANQPEVIPVPPSTAIKALSSSGTAVVRCTPMKVR